MKIEMNKKVKSIIAVYAILLFVYAVLFVAIPFNKNTASWLSFAFTVVAIMSSLFICGFAFFKKQTLVSKIYGFPIFKLGILYASVQFIAGIIICVISAFVPVWSWIPVVIFVLLSGIVAIGIIAADNSRDFIEETDENTKNETLFIKSLTVDAEVLISQAENDVIKAECERVFEAIRYSDPVSKEELSSCESEIEEKFSEFTKATKENSPEEVKKLADEVILFVEKINKKC